MEYSFKRKKNNLRIISAGVSLVILLSGCSITQNIRNNNSNYENTETVIQSSVEIGAYTSEISESSEITSEVTEPFECNISILADFANYMENQGYSMYSNNMPYTLGYDNPYMSQLINNYMSDNNSEYNNLTAEDFNYFIADSDQLTYFGNFGYDDYSMNDFPGDFGTILRATLIQNNLRIMIDEIPYSYFEERFPEFVADQSPEYQSILDNQCYDITSRIFDEQTGKLDMSELTDYEYDVLLFTIMRSYNITRSLYMYSGHVNQIREESTGRNILDPTESQLEDINERFGIAVGGDATQVETREHFYETYGMYPEDALYRETRYEGNVTETNTMYATAPSRQR